MSEVNIESLESALGEAFTPPPKEAAKPAPKAEAPEVPVEEDPADLLQGIEPEEEIAETPEAPTEEPSFEVEIEAGKPETLPLARLKELAVRGAKAGRGFEENARVREALQAHVVQAQIHEQFQQAAATDVAKIQALDQQLQQYDKVDWVAAYDTDLGTALKLKEQRDQLREQRAAAWNNLNAKQQQFNAQFQQNSQRLLAAETEALLAKVPAWRNAEKAKQEHGEISNALETNYGFTKQEISALMDHRMLLVARDAAAYRKLLANKDARVKQARDAPATSKPGSAPAQPNGRTELSKVIGKVKELGAKGNRVAQEQLVTKLFERAYK